MEHSTIILLFTATHLWRHSEHTR